MTIHFDIGPHHHHGIEAKRPSPTSPFLVHIKPVIHPHHYNGTGNSTPVMRYWCVSQYIKWSNKGHLVITTGERDSAIAICKLLIDSGFRDDRVEWQDSMQLNKIAQAMRSLGKVYERWGEKYTYTKEYASKVLPQEDIDHGAVPVYTVAENCGSLNPDNISEWWHGWSRWKGVWDRASLYLGDGEQQRFRKLG